MRPLAPLACLLAALAAAQPSDPRLDPYFADPALRAVMDWATLHVSFDGGTFTPDLAAGEAKVTVRGTPVFEPGVHGQALRVGEGGAQGTCARAGNAPLVTRGALALWLCPLGWTRVNGGNTVFVMTSNASFYLQRQGPAHADDGRLTRFEGLQFLLRAKDNPATLMQSTAAWPDRRWRLVVANWSWPTLSLSVDGQPFDTGSAKAAPAEVEFGDLLIGSTGGEPALIDEVLIFRRPLTLDEAKRLHATFQPKAAEAAGEAR